MFNPDLIHSLWVSLQITVMGMGLVFGAIILLWLIMIGLVRFTAQAPSHTPEETAEWDESAERELKLQAAAAAVAVAMQRRSALRPFVRTRTGISSPWQIGRQMRQG